MKLKYTKAITDKHGQTYSLHEENDVYGAKAIANTIYYTNAKFREAWEELEKKLKEEGLIKQEND